MKTHTAHNYQDIARGVRLLVLHLDWVGQSGVCCIEHDRNKPLVRYQSNGCIVHEAPVEEPDSLTSKIAAKITTFWSPTDREHIGALVRWLGPGERLLVEINDSSIRPPLVIELSRTADIDDGGAAIQSTARVVFLPPDAAVNSNLDDPILSVDIIHKVEAFALMLFALHGNLQREWAQDHGDLT